jgi:hypothetical protein
MFSHLAFSIASGAFFIYTLFHKVGENDVNDCIVNNSHDPTKVEDCRKAFKDARGMVIVMFIVFCLLELCASSPFPGLRLELCTHGCDRGLSHRLRLRLTVERGG